jgi:hypothetical protein
MAECKGSHNIVLRHEYTAVCPQCKFAYNGGESFQQTATAAQIHSYSHPQVIVNRAITYADGHQHLATKRNERWVTTPAEEPSERPTTLNYKQIAETHQFPKDVAVGTFKKYGSSQIGAILEEHYIGKVRNERFAAAKNSPFTAMIDSGKLPPISVAWNNGVPRVMPESLDALAIARKHSPMAPLNINYVD